jgi:hypothetical protein
VKDGLTYYIDDEGEKALDITVRTGNAPVSATTAASAAMAETGVKPQTLDFEIHYVSAANSMGPTGAKHKEDAVYLIRIIGAGLNRDQIFKNGCNGFRYEIDTALKPNSPDPDRYKVYAYPLAGVRYSDDGKSDAALNPNDIVFYWIGPKSDGSKYSVKITQ